MDNEALKDIIEKSKQLSPFEIKDELIHIAKKSKVKSTCKMLNAGRGNPNWTASTPRKSFFKLGEFAVDETERAWCDIDLAGMPLKDGIYARFKEYCKNNKNDSGIKLLEQVIEYGIKEHSFNPDEWLFELVDGIIGDNYPVPDRMLVHIEEIVKEYLIKEMGGNNNYNNYDLFAVEGGTAAMCYIFDSMKANGLLKEGSKIALMIPIFTPYLEIPNLPRYKFDVTYIYASEMDANGNHTWQYPKEELDKLKDPSIECLCVVNPSNPASVSINESGIEYLKHIVDNYNPNLMIVTDDVY